MVSIFRTILLFIAAGSAAAAVTDDVKYIFVFGDSYTETGFNITKAKPSIANPIGNPSFPGLTTAGGSNWLDKLVTTYNTSVTFAYNFAFSGATVDNSVEKGTAFAVVNQVNAFSTNLASKPSYAPWQASNSLFTVWIGINDIGYVFARKQNSSMLDKILVSYVNQVEILYKAGGRNFLFLTVPPIDKEPKVLTTSVADQALERGLVAYYNSALQVKITTFKTDYPNATVWLYDTAAPFNLALSDPQAYGAKDATCYNSDGTTCLWWNVYHPGQAIHNLVAKGVAKLLQGGFF